MINNEYVIKVIILFICSIIQTEYCLPVVYPRNCLIEPGVNPRDCSVYKLIPRKLKFFELKQRVIIGGKTIFHSYDISKCKDKCIKDTSCYSIRYDNIRGYCYNNNNYPVQLEYDFSMVSVIIACCTLDDFVNITLLIPEECKKDELMPNLRSCDISPFRKLTAYLFTNMKIRRTAYGVGNNLKECADHCMKNETCMGYNYNLNNKKCDFVPDGSDLLDFTSDYDAYIMMCCYFNISLKEYIEHSRDPTCDVYKNYTKDACTTDLLRSINWLGYKAVVPYNNSFISRHNTTIENCKDLCIKSISCISYIWYLNNNKSNCDLHSYNEYFTSTTKSYKTNLRACCGPKSNTTLLCLPKNSVTDSNFTPCYNMCYEKYLECLSDVPLQCDQLCDDCMIYCKKIVIESQIPL